MEKIASEKLKERNLSLELRMDLIHSNPETGEKENENVLYDERLELSLTDKDLLVWKSELKLIYYN